MSRKDNPFRWVEATKKEFEKRIEVNPKFLLGILNEIVLCCEKCKLRFNPPWLDKRHSLHPIKLKNGLLAVPCATPVKCPKCGNSIDLKLPVNTVKGQAYTFIDEAYRNFESGLGLTNYSSVSVSRGKFDKTLLSWKKFKEDLVNIGYLESGDSLHITEIKDKDPKLARIVIEKAACWLQNYHKENGEALRLYSSTVILNENANSKLMKRIAFEGYFQVSQIESSRGGLQLVYFLEDDGHQGWINEMIKELSHSLMYPFVASGLPMEKPKQIGKGEGLTEIADLIAFTVSRHYFDSLMGNPPFIDSTKLGAIHQILINEFGLVKFHDHGVSSDFIQKVELLNAKKC